MATAGRRSENLPPPVTSFVGRQVDRAEVGRLVAPGTLVTLTGAGGSGKSRLGIEVARDALEQYPSGACLVRLATVRESDLVASAVATALDIREEAGRPLAEVVIDRLRTEELLLLLDNAEHVLDGVRALAARLSAEARGVAVLATSREPLRVPGEQVWPVAPLEVPRPTTDPEEISASAAARLFVDRAGQVRPDFVLSADNAATVAALCRQLGGLPLAIELVAPWVRVLSVGELNTRVEELLRVPSTAGGEGHHRSVDAALDWSLELLSDEQRVLFRRLSVFAGGFSLDAAEAVAGEGLGAVLTILAALVDKGLVVAEVGTAARSRYRLLEPVRQYAARQLEATDEADGIRSAHAHYFLDLATRAARHLHTDEQVDWLTRLDEEEANLRAADEYVITHGRSDLALRLVGALQQYWWLRGRVEEGPRRLQRALETSTEGGVARARALVGLGGFLLVAGDYDRAERVVTEAVELYRTAGHRPGLARALGTLTRIAYNQGDVAASERHGGQALELYEELGNPGGVAWMLIGLGGPAAARGDRERHRRLIDRAGENFTARGDRWGMGWVLGMQGALALIDGDAAGAARLLDRSLDRFAEIGNRDAAAVRSLSVRAVARTRQGDLAGARQDVTEALELGARTGDFPSLAYAVTAAADVMTDSDRPVVAAEILAAARNTTSVPSYVRTELTEQVDARLRERLDTATLAAASDAHGRHRSPVEILDEVRAVTVEGTAPGPPPLPTEALLVREGEFWTVKLGEETTRLRDLKGLHYLAYLLAHPDREFHVLDLVAEVEQVSAEGMDRGDTGPLLDPQAKAAYRRRLEELDDALEEAELRGDDVRAERAHAEREHLTRELAAAIGLGGRDRRAGAASERARVNVTRLIGTVVRKLGDDCPALAHLLRTTVRTGTYCAYEPPPRGGPHWSL